MTISNSDPVVPLMTAAADSYRRAAVVQVITTAAIVYLLIGIRPPGYIASFGVVHMGLQILLFVAVSQARRLGDPREGYRLLVWATGILLMTLSLHTAWLAVDVRAHGTDAERTEAALLVIGSAVFYAMQNHMTRAGYVAAVAPPLMAIVWFGINRRDRLVDPHLLQAVGVFVMAIVGSTFRQFSTDRNLIRTRLQLVETNEALSLAIEQTRAASQAKTEFLAVASHEIRTPLNAVVGMTEVLKRKPLEADERDLVVGIGDASQMLMRLLNAVLDWSKIDSGRHQATFAPMDLHQAVSATAGVWKARCRMKGVELLLCLRAVPDPCWIMGDLGKIEQTLVNLISNATKFTPPGGTIRVIGSVKSNENGAQQVELKVEDDGPGVAIEDRRRIFEAFEQTVPGQSAGGAGLGLTISQANVHAFDGEIGVEASDSGGARFWVRWPAAQAPAMIIERAGIDEAAVEALRVLVVEDNPANRHVLSMLLGPIGVDLTLAENGQEALEILIDAQFDVILMDANMPVMDGLTATRRIRAGRGGDPHVPIFMLTANVLERDIASYLAAGANGVLTKPIDMRALIAALSNPRGEGADDSVVLPAG